MARKSFTPLGEGEHITANRINDLFDADGVEGILTNIAGEQIEDASITLRACNQGVRTAASTAGRGTGSPWFGGEAPSATGINNQILDSPGQVIQSTTDSYIRAGGNDLAIDLTHQVNDCLDGDFALIELSGQAHFFHYLAGGSAQDNNGVIAGSTPDYAKYFGTIFLQVTKNATTVNIPHSSIPGNDAHFGSILINGSYAGSTYNSGKLYPTVPTQTPYVSEANIGNTGPGTYRSFHISVIVPLDGDETVLQCKAKCLPGQAITSPAPFANPVAHILNARFTGRVIRKGEK
tara:strand:- start:953 stop:1828 length:876 start_codon:yes stop_codon:yes gene_type:complete